MNDELTWDCETSEKQIPIKEWQDTFNWVEDFQVSPDGEKVAAIVNQDEAEFSVCVNGEVWDDTFEKAWSLKFTPQSIPMALVAKDDEWTACVNGTCWEDTFDFIWGLTASDDGTFIGAAIQMDMTYGLAVNGQAWETLYENIGSMTLNRYGSAAAVVQADRMAQADIDTFSSGIYCAAVDGVVQSEKYMNVWDLTFDDQGKQIAYAIRKDRSHYTLAVDKTPWQNTFQSVWNPVFIENGQSVIVSARKNGKWRLYKDDNPFWQSSFGQMWKLTLNEQKNKIAAVVSDKFGHWTVCENERVWDFHCNTMISDLFYSENGDQLIAVCKNNDSWDIVINSKPWGLQASKLWKPVISSNGQWCATRMEKNKKQWLVVNGTVCKASFDQLFDPVISQDNSKILIKSINNGIYSRQVLELETLC